MCVYVARKHNGTWAWANTHTHTLCECKWQLMLNGRRSLNKNHNYFRTRIKYLVDFDIAHIKHLFLYSFFFLLSFFRRMNPVSECGGSNSIPQYWIAQHMSTKKNWISNTNGYSAYKVRRAFARRDKYVCVWHQRRRTLGVRPKNQVNCRTEKYEKLKKMRWRGRDK